MQPDDAENVVTALLKGTYAAAGPLGRATVVVDGAVVAAGHWHTIQGRT